MQPNRADKLLGPACSSPPAPIMPFVALLFSNPSISLLTNCDVHEGSGKRGDMDVAVVSTRARSA
jgi:hypothetical protein